VTDTTAPEAGPVRPATRYTIHNHEGVYVHVGDRPELVGSAVQLCGEVTRRNRGADIYIAIPEAPGSGENPYSFDITASGELLVTLKADGKSVRAYAAGGWLESEPWLQAWGRRDA
jgi:hypothetical protein